jgi:uncharacterized membrane protein YecN with MAPEG domain
MPYVHIVTALAILQFMVFGVRVGAARARYGVPAPATSGNPLFERHFRVQANTLELLVALLPALYLYSQYFNPLIAAGLGGVYLIGRELYAFSYVRDPGKRGPGFGLSYLPIVVLIVGGLFGAIRQVVMSRG